MSTFSINQRQIAPGQRAYIIAELSANHNQDFDTAVKILHAAKSAGVDAVKIQTYTADTITINSRKPPFLIKGTIWDGRNLHDLYREASLPWEWHAPLQKIAQELELDFFSTPFDFSAVDFLEDLDVPAYKVASFEVVDVPLLRYIASTGKPVIMSTGMASIAEINEAVETLRTAGCNNLALLKCTSTYPALPKDMNLRTIPNLAQTFDVVSGLSDHSMGATVPIAAVTLGACIIEKHLTLSRDMPGPDSSFSMEPNEFKFMVDAIRTTEDALGAVSYSPNEKERNNRVFRRSLFVVEDVKAGEAFTTANVRSIRPSHGLHTRNLSVVIGAIAKVDIEAGTPLHWDLVA